MQQLMMNNKVSISWSWHFPNFHQNLIPFGTKFYQDLMFLTMKQLVNNCCAWLPLMLLDRFLPHLQLNDLFLLPTITIITVTLKLIVVQRQENNNDNHGSLSLLYQISLKTSIFASLITTISFNSKQPINHYHMSLLLNRVIL